MAAKEAQPSYPNEERGAEALTIAWMLTALATFVGMLCALGAFLVVRNLPQPLPPSLAALPALLLLIEGVGGLLALALTPLVLRLRKTKPPRSITQAVLLTGSLPSILMIALELLG